MVFRVAGMDVAKEAVFSAIAVELGTGKKVLWLVSGGSCVPPQVEIMQRLQEQVGQALGQLTILPVDERYGPYDHVDSNSASMRHAGFTPGTATWYDILLKNLHLAETRAYYERVATTLVASADVIIATLGMGADAHTAGLLPRSDAVADTTTPVIAYQWTDYTRLTLGVCLLRKIDRASVFAYGQTKKAALERLHENAAPFQDMPAKLLYDLPDATVYNEYIQT